ncbi:MAG: EVE domain-containing protein [Pseudanabaenaceae cyanobacterium bins.68]|nr:EVE domain-containing protein [Pseudanabaenaceae cyanobacterium bins.68]
MLTRPQYWLLKSEPLTYSIDHLASDRTTDWEGIRNYQARNFMRDQMQVDDLAIFYHSNTKPPGAAGVCRISQPAHPDHSAWNPSSPYFDPTASPTHPRWWMVEVTFISKFKQLVSLPTMRQDPELQDMLLLQKGQRLSIQPLTASQFHRICILAGEGEARPEL